MWWQELQKAFWLMGTPKFTKFPPKKPPYNCTCSLEKAVRIRLSARQA